MRTALAITARFTLPIVGIATIAAIFTLPTGISSGPVGPWFGLLSLAGIMISAGAVAWLLDQTGL